MPADQPGPKFKPDPIVALTELSRELRSALEDVGVHTTKVLEITRQNAKGGGREPEVLAACEDQAEVLKRFRGTWDRARKPIIKVGVTSKYGENLLAEFRCLSLRPTPLEVLKFVQFLEVVLDTEASVADAELSDNVQPPISQKRPRGRPSTISPERKAKALESRLRGGNNLDAAKILFDTESPNTSQLKSVSGILAWECQKQSIAWPLPKTRPNKS
jgi:hypothetical protein